MGHDPVPNWHWGIELAESANAVAGRQHSEEHSHSQFLLNGIRDLREALFVPGPAHRDVPKDSGIHTMSAICAMPFGNNRHVFNVLFADETSQKCVSLSGLISLSNSEESGKMGINIMDCSAGIITGSENNVKSTVPFKR